MFRVLLSKIYGVYILGDNRILRIDKRGTMIILFFIVLAGLLMFWLLKCAEMV